jgi:enoyl-CoA hydratase/carnithine racemase
VISGAGGEFCAGADLGADRGSGMTSVTEAHQRMKIVERAATALYRTTKPTIAAVDGVAVGAGMNLALGCDVVIATDRARFSEIFVRRGLTVDFGGTWLLPRTVGLQRAKELALSGRIVPADEALRLGIAMEVVAAEDLPGRVAEVAKSFLDGAPIAQMFAKQGLNASFESSFSESISWEGQSQAIALGTEDVKEGVTAFLEKRDPRWKGR